MGRNKKGEIYNGRVCLLQCLLVCGLLMRRTEGEWRLKRKGLEIDLWLTSPQREAHSGNCSVHTKQRGCLHYSSPAVKHSEAVRVNDGVETCRDKKEQEHQTSKENSLCFLFFFLCVCFLTLTQSFIC